MHSCEEDVRTGFYVFRVPFTELKRFYKDEISEGCDIATVREHGANG